MKRKINKVPVIFAIFFILFACMAFSFLLKNVILKQDRVVLNISQTTTIGSITVTKNTGTIEVPSYYLLFYPFVFIMFGLLSMSKGFRLTKLNNLLGVFVFFVMGIFILAFRPPFPFNLIAWLFVITGALMTIGMVRLLMPGRFKSILKKLKVGKKYKN